MVKQSLNKFKNMFLENEVVNYMVIFMDGDK